MPRKPNATRPNAKIAGATIIGRRDLIERHDTVGDRHQAHDRQAQPVGAEVAGDQAGQDVERRAAFARRGHDFLDVRRVRRGEDLDELGDDRAGQRAAADDRRQLPPQVGVAAERRNQQVRQHVGEHHRDDRGQPHQRWSAAPRSSSSRRRRSLALGDRVVDEIRARRGQHHHHAHHEDPHQQLHLDVDGSLTASMMNEISATPVTP